MFEHGANLVKSRDDGLLNHVGLYFGLLALCLKANIKANKKATNFQFVAASGLIFWMPVEFQDEVGYQAIDLSGGNDRITVKGINLFWVTF